MGHPCLTLRCSVYEEVSATLPDRLQLWTSLPAACKRTCPEFPENKRAVKCPIALRYSFTAAGIHTSDALVRPTLLRHCEENDQTVEPPSKPVRAVCHKALPGWRSHPTRTRNLVAKLAPDRGALAARAVSLRGFVSSRLISDRVSRAGRSLT